MTTTTKAFGPGALLTPANLLTVGRLAATPVMIALIVTYGPVSWLVWAVWTVLAFTDGIDGLIARRQGTTRSGAFLDPLADKFLVLGALAALAWRHDFSWAPVGLIAFRELAMSVYRTSVGRAGVSVPARPLAKLKTLAQDLAVGIAVFPPIGRPYPSVARDVLWVAVALTIVTGLQYVVDGRRLAAAHHADEPSGVSRHVDSPAA